LRPDSAASWICELSITRASSPDVRLTVSPLTAVTSTASVRPPTDSAKSAVMRPSAISAKPLLSAFLKPSICALTL
jgi:hypothetical protein